MNDARGDTGGVPTPGEVVSGKYRVERVLGAGGMGVVLAAQHLDLAQPVAIKFLNAQYAHDAEMVTRFLREARAAAAVRSEHVARVLDVNRTEAGVPYIVMEHLDGTDLDQLVRARGPLPIEGAVDYVLQACEAIAEAHAARIIHRDLKPANLFLTHRADGSPLVKVLDFGMSKVLATDGASGDGSLTSPAAVLGSPWYMSPEQLRATKYVDHRTDVWALGVILYKLLGAAQPFEAPTVASCLVKIVTEPPVPLRSRRPEVPAALETVIGCCLEKDVDRRLQNVAELAQALLPFAPPPSRISVERIVRVLLGSDLPGHETLSRSVVAAPALAESSTAGAITRTPAVTASSTPRWPLATAAVLLFLAGIVFVIARISAASRAAPSSAATVEPPAATSPPPEVTTSATSPTPAPAPPSATAAPATQKPAPIPKPVPAPVKPKVAGPMERSF
jgi:serine/threonine protein kinase